MNKCIAIDGPSGTGKSTTAKKLSSLLGIVYVDTGAMYRALGYTINKNGIDVTNENDVIKNMDSVTLELKFIDECQHIFANDEDVTDFIRTEEVGRYASTIARYESVREKMVEMQQNIAKDIDVIMDGRDIGTCVLPNANFKFYIDADEEVRAKRRVIELTEKGLEASYDKILEDVRERDYRDKNRENSPLIKAKDAIYIDTSKLTERQVVSLMMKIIEDK